MSKKRKIVWAIVVAPVVAILFLVGRIVIAVAMTPGVYLTDGGFACIAIGHTWSKGWTVSQHYWTEWGPWSGYEEEVSSAWPKLILLGKDKNRNQPTGGPRWLDWRFQFDYDGAVVFERSRTRRGDWDLVAYRKLWSNLPPPAPPPPPRTGLWKVLDKWWPRPNYPEAIPLKQRLPYLHRVNDWRILDYFELQDRKRDPAGAYSVASAILKDHSRDLHVRLLYLLAAARYNDVEEVARRLDEWKKDFDAAADEPCLQWAHNYMKSWLRGQRLSAADQNVFQFCVEVFNRQTDLATRLRVFPKVLDMEAYVPTRLPRDWATLSFLELQVWAKVTGVIAILRMFEGRRQECLQPLAAVYRLGQMMATEGPSLIERLVGAAVAQIASRTLAMYALNCCETNADFQQLWAMLEKIGRGRRSQRADELLLLEHPVDRALPYPTRSDLTTATIRTDCWSVQFDLLRMATAAKYRFLTQGDFPANYDRLRSLLSGNLPRDPFSGGSLKFLSTGEAFVGYSVGPDRRDDRAAVEYDPTNGTVSGGDILLRVPRERQYPFPREGVRAASVADLLRQFPNGLPLDSFASTKGKPLSTTTTTAGDVYIYSYGPNVDEFKLPQPHRLQCPYDPTNGTVSEGDIFLRIPRR